MLGKRRGEEQRQKDAGEQFLTKRLASRDQNNWVTLFVDNLPRNMSKVWLWQLFKNEEGVKEVFLSMKKRKHTDLLFGFVRIARESDSSRTIKRMDGIVIKGNKLKVKKADYVRREEVKQDHQTPYHQYLRVREKAHKAVVRDARTYCEVVANGEKQGVHKEAQKKQEEENGATKMVMGKVCDEKLEWLQRSVVGETEQPQAIESVEANLINDWRTITKVTDMGCFKFLVTFSTKEDMEEALGSGYDILKNTFAEVRKWSIEDLCLNRRVWIECHGIPPHAWSYYNLIKIGELWGDVICFDNPTMTAESMASAKILVDTLCLSFINEWIYLSVEGNGFDVHIKEVGRDGWYCGEILLCIMWLLLNMRIQ